MLFDKYHWSFFDPDVSQSHRPLLSLRRLEVYKHFYRTGHLLSTTSPRQNQNKSLCTAKAYHSNASGSTWRLSFPIPGSSTGTTNNVFYSTCAVYMLSSARKMSQCPLRPWFRHELRANKGDSGVAETIQAQYVRASMHLKQLTGLEYTTRREELERHADIMLALWHIQNSHSSNWLRSSHVTEHGDSVGKAAQLNL